MCAPQPGHLVSSCSSRRSVVKEVLQTGQSIATRKVTLLRSLSVPAPGSPSTCPPRGASRSARGSIHLPYANARSHGHGATAPPASRCATGPPPRHVREPGSSPASTPPAAPPPGQPAPATHRPQSVAARRSRTPPRPQTGHTPNAARAPPTPCPAPRTTPTRTTPPSPAPTTPAPPARSCRPDGEPQARAAAAPSNHAAAATSPTPPHPSHAPAAPPTTTSHQTYTDRPSPDPRPGTDHTPAQPAHSRPSSGHCTADTQTTPSPAHPATHPTPPPRQSTTSGPATNPTDTAEAPPPALHAQSRLLLPTHLPRRAARQPARNPDRHNKPAHPKRPRSTHRHLQPAVLIQPLHSLNHVPPITKNHGISGNTPGGYAENPRPRAQGGRGAGHPSLTLGRCHKATIDIAYRH